MSPRKMRVVANVVRGKKVEEAVGLLDLMPKKAAGIISKAIKSAAASRGWRRSDRGELG